MIVSMAARPSMIGIMMSMTTRSGFNRSVRSTASLPFSASPATSISEVAWNISFNTPLTRGESSASNTFIMYPSAVTKKLYIGFIDSIADPERPPMSPLHVNRRRNIPHFFTCIAEIYLHQQLLRVSGCSQPHRIVEQAFAPVAGPVQFLVAGQRLGIFRVVSRQIAVPVDQHREYYLRVLLQVFVLNLQDRLIQKGIIFCVIFLGIRAWNRLIIFVEKIIQCELTAVYRFGQNALHDSCTAQRITFSPRLQLIFHQLLQLFRQLHDLRYGLFGFPRAAGNLLRHV